MTVPAGWVATSIGEVTDLSAGAGFPKHLQGRTEGDFPFAKVSDISRAVQQHGAELATAANYIGAAELTRLKAKVVAPGSTVFAKIGEAVRLNRRALVKVPLVVDNNVMALTPIAGGCDPDFLFRWMQTVDLGPLTVATAVPSVRGGDVASLHLMLPPLAEQRRIVAKLDALTARLARARAELDRVSALAERLRASVLGEVFSLSNLTRWPTERMEEQIAEGLIGLVRSKAEQGDTGVPYVRMNHYDLDGRINEDKLTFVDCSKAELARFQLQAGDVLFNTRNSVELVGKVTIWPQDMPGRVYNNNILRLRFGPAMDPRFALRYMMSPFFRGLMEQEKSATTSVAAIYQRSLYAAPLPVPPKDEQATLARQIEDTFARADRMEAEAARARALIDRLEAALLAKAFRGELVPQDPADEPASALLARIRATRAAAPKARRGRKAKENA